LSSDYEGGAGRMGYSETPGAAWACACDAGWVLFPAVGAAPRCTVSHATVLIMAALQAVASVVILGTTVGKLCGRRRVHATFSFTVGLFSLVAAALQLDSPARLSVGSNTAVFCLKMTSGMLTNDVCARLMLLKYRAAASAWAAQETGKGLETSEAARAAIVRTRVEIAVSLCVFAGYLYAATRWSMSTRAAAGVFYFYWSFAPAWVWLFSNRMLRRHLEDLDWLQSLCLDSADRVHPSVALKINSLDARISLAKAAARKMRRYIAWGFGAVIVANAVSFTLLFYSDQWCWLVGEFIFSVSPVGFALTSLNLTRNSRSRNAVIDAHRN
jgi:hypothetical protein